MNSNADLPDEGRMLALLEKVAPGSTLLTVTSAPGSYSNFTHIVSAQARDGSTVRLVVRRYKVFGSYDRGEKSRREFRAFELLRLNDLPGPEPVYLDDQGAVLGSPGIVTRYVDGAQVESPTDPIAWACALATTLARIHAVDCDPATRQVLLDADVEATWFLRGGTVPPFMAAHPDGEAVWHLVHDLWPFRKIPEPALVHIDYWPGNVLWKEGRIVAVVDWEEAAYGDPAIDVAYCRMDLALRGMDGDLAAFLDAYETAVGHPVANLGLWELAAAARPMYSPEGWITGSPAAERFRAFIAGAMARVRS